MKPLEQLLPREERDRLRREALQAEPRWYSPWLHVALPSLFGLGIAAAALAQIRHLRLWELGFFAGVLVLSNATEWRAHRDLLHKRFRPLGVLYDRHTPQHHMIFVRGDMALRDPREFRLVLIPIYGIVAIFFVTAPPAALLWSFGQINLAALYLAATMLYVVSYEWMHLAWHLPETSFIGSLRLVRLLREHHAVHHDPRLMQRWNFNVTVPLWDLVRRTYLRSGASERAEA
jgi:hypothetical protein